MTISISMICNQVQTQPLVNFQGGGGGGRLNINMEPFYRRKDKVVVVMGTTGAGKSKLAIDLAKQIPAEVVNSDKIQVYKGLDILTNKITEEECQGVPHHLIGIIDQNSDFTTADFNSLALNAVDSITNFGRLPIIAGGSNSYIESLVSEDPEFRLRYECCFLWVDVSIPVLNTFVSDRVDKMVRLGLVDEVKQIFDPNADYSRGIRRAVGVPELDDYLRIESSASANDETKKRLLEVGIAKIKENTYKLVCRQLQKIRRLHNQWIWNMHRIDATEVLLKQGEEADDAWEKLVVRPSARIVERFLDDGYMNLDSVSAIKAISAKKSVPAAAAAAAYNRS